jgi:hypothetical protein
MPASLPPAPVRGNPPPPPEEPPSGRLPPVSLPLVGLFALLAVSGLVVLGWQLAPPGTLP